MIVNNDTRNLMTKVASKTRVAEYVKRWRRWALGGLGNLTVELPGLNLLNYSNNPGNSNFIFTGELVSQ